MKYLALAITLLALTACTQPHTPRQDFVTACSTVGEAMIQVIEARRLGKIDTQTFTIIDDHYDAAVSSCSTLPPTDSAAQLALDRLNAFLLAASGATGVNYGTY